jgi:hypothetical protein
MQMVITYIRDKLNFLSKFSPTVFPLFLLLTEIYLKQKGIIARDIDITELKSEISEN